MFPRSLQPPRRGSFFLFGPRGTGKSSWMRQRFADAPYFDLLAADVQLDLAAGPERLAQRIPPGHRGWVVIDEIQRVPELLDEVHRLIEGKRLRFALTASSARKLRRGGVNLLAGRARTLAMHPLTHHELGDAFELRRALQLGMLPEVWVLADRGDAREYLRSYVHAYVREEVLQEGLTRNLGAFTRFLEAASFSQASTLNVASVARECGVERKIVEHYFGILEDLLIAIRLPVFTRRARRQLVAHPKFYFFDAGVFRSLRPRGPLDSDAEIDGAAAETLLLHELRAANDYGSLGYALHFWRTRDGLEVDFVLYGERGLKAFEVKRGSRLRSEDLRGIQAFASEYPAADTFVLYGGTRAYREGRTRVLPLAEGLRELVSIL